MATALRLAVQTARPSTVEIRLNTTEGVGGWDMSSTFNHGCVSITDVDFTGSNSSTFSFFIFMFAWVMKTHEVIVYTY